MHDAVNVIAQRQNMTEGGWGLRRPQILILVQCTCPNSTHSTQKTYFKSCFILADSNIHQEESKNMSDSGGSIFGEGGLLGSKISIITESNYRYEGILKGGNSRDNTIEFAAGQFSHVI